MNCIVNVTEDWGIGLENRLLVSLSADLRRFRALTSGGTVILGRKTLLTFPGGRPLPNRTHLVLSTDCALEIPGAEVLHSLDALAARCAGLEDVWVIGGASVYAQLLPYCAQARITRTFLRPRADQFFPDLDALPEWRQTWASEVLEEQGVAFQYLDYAQDAPRPFRPGALVGAVL